MAQLAKYLLSKHEDTSSIPTTQVWEVGRWRQSIPGAHLTASVFIWVISGWMQRPSLKTESGEQFKKRPHMLSTGFTHKKGIMAGMGLQPVYEG